MMQFSYIILIVIITSSVPISGNSTTGESCMDDILRSGICIPSNQCNSTDLMPPSMGNCTQNEVCCEPNGLPGFGSKCTLDDSNAGICKMEVSDCELNIYSNSTCRESVCCKTAAGLGQNCDVDKFCVIPKSCNNFWPGTGKCSSVFSCCEASDLPVIGEKCYVDNVQNGTCISSESCIDGKANLCQNGAVCCTSIGIEIGETCDSMSVCTLEEGCLKSNATQGACNQGHVCCNQNDLPNINDRCYVGNGQNGTCLMSDSCFKGKPNLCSGAVCCTQTKIELGEMCDPMSFCSSPKSCSDSNSTQGACTDGNVCCSQNNLPGKGMSCGTNNGTQSLCTEEKNCLKDGIVDKPGLCNEQTLCCSKVLGVGLECCNNGTYKMFCDDNEISDETCDTCDLPELKCCVRDLGKICTYQVQGSRQKYFGNCQSMESCVNNFLQLQPVSIHDDLSGDLECNNPSLQCCDG